MMKLGICLWLVSIGLATAAMSTTMDANSENQQAAYYTKIFFPQDERDHSICMEFQLPSSCKSGASYLKNELGWTNMASCENRGFDSLVENEYEKIKLDDLCGIKGNYFVKKSVIKEESEKGSIQFGSYWMIGLIAVGLLFLYLCLLCDLFRQAKKFGKYSKMDNTESDDEEIAQNQEQELTTIVKKHEALETEPEVETLCEEP